METNNQGHSENKMKKGDILQIYTDGASRGNPGPSAYAFVFVSKNDKKVIYKEADYLGETTNNKAEYNAIINALEKAAEYTKGDIEVYSDSELAIKQINREYKIKNKDLQKLCDRVYSLKERYASIKFVHVPRENEFTRIADKMCNEVLDEKMGKSSKNRH